MSDLKASLEAAAEIVALGALHCCFPSLLIRSQGDHQPDKPDLSFVLKYCSGWDKSKEQPARLWKTHRISPGKRVFTPGLESQLCLGWQYRTLAGQASVTLWNPLQGWQTLGENYLPIHLGRWTSILNQVPFWVFAVVMQDLECVLEACKHHGKLVWGKREPVLPNRLCLICSSQSRDSSVCSLCMWEKERM